MALYLLLKGEFSNFSFYRLSDGRVLISSRFKEIDSRLSPFNWRYYINLHLSGDITIIAI